MSQPSLLLLFREAGPVYRKHLGVFCQAARALDASLLVLLHADAEAAIPIIEKSGYSHEICDLDQISELRERVRALHQARGLDRLFAFVERDVYTAALCRKDCGIKGLLPASAIHFRDKHVMHARARELGFRVPRSCYPETLLTIHSFAHEVGYPVIIKPYNGAGSANTWKIDTAQALQDIWGRIQDQRRDYRVEEYIEGTQFFVDMLMCQGRSIFGSLSRYTYHVLNFRSEIPGGILLRAPFVSEHRQMLDATERLLQGLGLETGLSHTEWFLTKTGEIVLGETAARFGGGPIAAMIEHSYQIQIIEEWLQAELDPTHQVALHEGPHIGAEYFAADQYGAFGEVTDIADTTPFHLCKEVLEVEIWKAKGDIIEAPVRCSEVLGYYICEGHSDAAVMAHFADIRRHFFVRTKP